MAKYTAELNDLLKDENFNNLLKNAMNSYPLYEPIHKELYGYIPTREELNKKIINHYRFYEIGSETPGRFLYNIEMTLNEIMPYYNQMYKSVDVMNGIDDIFGNVDIVESFEEETEGNSSSQSSGNSSGSTSGTNTSTTTSTNTSTTEMDTEGRNASSKTPQSQLQAKTLDNITSASEMSWNEDKSNSSSSSNDEASTTATSSTESNQESSNQATSNASGITRHTLSKKGNQGVNTYAHDMLEFRQLFLNIEQQIINNPELAKCFMLIW